MRREELYLLHLSLERVSGRGFMYICCGTLQVLVRLSVFMLSGSFALAAGGFMVYTGQTSRKEAEYIKEGCCQIG